MAIEHEENDDFAKKLVELAKQFTPDQSLWWSRKALFEQMYDTIEEMIDGDAAVERWDRARDRMQEDERDRWLGRGAGFQN